MLDNLVVLCPSHHTLNSDFSAHKTPEAFSRWFQEKFSDRYRNVIKKAQVMMSEREAIQEFEVFSEMPPVHAETVQMTIHRYMNRGLSIKEETKAPRPNNLL